MKLRSARYSVDTRVQFEPDEWGAYALNNIMVYDVRNKSISNAVKERIEQLMNDAPTKIIEVTVSIKIYSE